MPSAISAVIGRRSSQLVWHNEIGGLTYRFDTPGGPRFVKWVPATYPISAHSEAARLRWAAPFTPVPHVIDVGDDDTGSWLLTEAIAGLSAVDDRWLAEPRTAVVAIGEGLAAIHTALPYDECPFTWSTQERVNQALAALATPSFNPDSLSDEHKSLGADQIAARLGDVPDADPVVCHGDPCSPNTLIDDAGRWCAHVDLDQLGRGDRWADLAVAAWSTEWNYGPGWDRLLVDAYGVPYDAERAAFFRLLWDLA
jgi:kanamycin kinase